MATTEINWQYVWDLPEDGRRYEAIGGELYSEGACTPRHQSVVLRLSMEFHRLLEKPGYGFVVYGPVGVEFPSTHEGVQPDLLFVSDARRSIVSDDWIRGSPDLMVEVVSPTTAERDRGLKLDLYRRQGVVEYWIVDADEDLVDVWRFGGEPEYEQFTDRLSVHVGEETVGEIDLKEIFLRD